MNDTIKSEIDLLRIDLPFIISEIVKLQYKIQPEFEKYGTKGMQHSLEDAKFNLEYLFSAIEVDSKILFQQYNQWTNRLFTNLNLPKDTLNKFYYCTKEVFKQRFIKGLVDEELFIKLMEYIELGIDSLRIQEYEEHKSFFKIDNPLKEHLQKYSDFVFSGDRNSATKLILDISQSTIEIKDIYKHIIGPFQLKLGNLWHENKISVAQEHYGTAVSQFAMSLLYEKIFDTPKNEKIFLGTCVEGELHELGMRMVCDYMESCGYNTYYLGANMPESGIIQMIKEKNPNIVAVSCTMTFNVSKVRSLIQTIKNNEIHVPIIVGGFPFSVDKDLWVKMGSDGCSKDFEDAFLLSERLCRGGKNDIL